MRKLVALLNCPVCRVAVTVAMNLTLLAPGLLWPNQTGPDLTEGLALPALARILGLGQATLGEGETFDAAVLRAWGTNPDVATGTLRRLGEAAEHQDAQPSAPAWLCADPVHLQVTRDHILLEDFSADTLSLDEARALAASLNAFLAEHEPTLGALEVAAPTRWYLPLPHPCTTTTFHPLAAAIGRPISRYMPQGENARRWRQLANEWQMLLHAHPVNAEREARGLQPVNALWLWGGGELPARSGLHVPAPHVFADHILARGLAHHAGSAAAPIANFWSNLPAGDAWVVDERLLAPALQLDLSAWRSTLVTFERDCCVPLLAALRAGRIRRVDLISHGERATLRATLGARSHWAFWRQPRALAEFQPAAPTHQPETP